MRFHAKLMPPLFPFAIFLGGSCSVLLKDWIVATFSNRAIRYLVYVFPCLPALAILYIANLVAIIISCPSDLQERMKSRWRNYLVTGRQPDLFGSADDLVDRAAATVVWWQWRRILK